MIMKKLALVTTIAVAMLGLLSACATQPEGPTIPVMPGPNKPFVQFQSDDRECQDYASSRVAGGAQAANNQALAEGILGTALGAGLGAAVGGGQGAGVGAASGAVVGTAVGANTSGGAQYGLQERYNIAYAQCMTSKGNRVTAGYAPAPYYGYPPYPPPPPY
jgi:uncharacterized protein YcfJ